MCRPRPAPMVQSKLVLMLMISLRVSSACDVFPFLRLFHFANRCLVHVSWWTRGHLVFVFSEWGILRPPLPLGPAQPAFSTFRWISDCYPLSCVCICLRLLICSGIFPRDGYLTCFLSLIFQEMVTQNCVVIFSKSTCPFCRMAKNVFNEIGTNYKVIELDEHNDGRRLQEALAHMTGARTVPAWRSSGFEEEHWLNARRPTKRFQLFIVWQVQSHKHSDHDSILDWRSSLPHGADLTSAPVVCAGSESLR